MAAETLPQVNTASAWSPEIFEGSHGFTVHKYSLCRGIGTGNSISSKEFSVGGCSWRVDLYPDGFDDANSDSIAVFVSLVSGKFEQVSFKIILQDQGPEKKHRIKETQNPLNFERNWGRGWRDYMKRDELEASDFLKDDCIRIRCVLRVIQKQNVLVSIASSITLPPSNILLQLQHLLESGKGADVIFDVAGEKFSAHKLILAARSSVFSAQFFGLLKDEVHPIKVEEIEATTFKMNDDDSTCTPFLMYQRLFAAADRYDLERLKMLCASRIHDNISVGNVTSIWAFASRHHCPSLLSCCAEFVASIKCFEDLFETEDFKQIKESDPSAVADFLRCVVLPKTET